MIFPSLIDYYNRLSKTEDVPPFGFSIEDIGFSINIFREYETLKEKMLNESGRQ